MSSSTLITLLALLLLLPAVGALAARLLGARYGVRLAQAIGGVSFAVALSSAVVLSNADVEASELGALAVMIPAPGPVIDADAFTLSPSTLGSPAEQLAADVVVVETPQAAQAALAMPATPTLEPTATRRPVRTPRIPTPTPTIEPTSAPSATVEPTATLEPTALPEPTAPPEPTAVVAAPTEQPAAREPLAYTVARGDTLRSIAERFGVSVEELARYNGLSAEEADSLRLDQQLFIPPERTTDQPAAPPPPAPTEAPAPPEPVAYTVEPGDTLRGIAERFGVGVASLARYNGLSPEEADSLRPGQRLFIPPG